MICRFCSAQIDPNAQFCMSCGNRLTVQDKLVDDLDATVLAPELAGIASENGTSALMPNEIQPKKKRSGKALFIILPIVLVAAIAVALILFFVFKDNNGEATSETTQAAVTKAQAEVTIPAVTIPSEQQPDWKIQYEKTLQKMIDDGYRFNAAWVSDVDGDGVPMIALSTVNASYRIPNVIINYKDGKVIVKNDIENSGTGSSVVDEVWFCEGTDSFIYRYYGNTSGTFTTNRQYIYGISEFGSYSLLAEKEIYLPGEYDAEIAKLYESGGDFDFSKYQGYIVDELNKSAYKFLGENAILINYANVMADFYAFESDTDPDSVIKAAISYLNTQLGTSLAISNKPVSLSKDGIVGAYKKVLSTCTEGNRYGVFDIDGDGIKELIVETGIYKADLSWNIYTYDIVNGNATNFLGAFESGYYSLYTQKDQTGLFMYCVVREREDMKVINISEGKAKESVVVEVRPYDQNNAINPGEALEMTDYNDFSLLNNM